MPREVAESTGSNVVNAVFEIPGAPTRPIWINADRLQGVPQYSRNYPRVTDGWSSAFMLDPSLVKLSSVDALLPAPMWTISDEPDKARSTRFFGSRDRVQEGKVRWSLNRVESQGAALEFLQYQPTTRYF